MRTKTSRGWLQILVLLSITGTAFGLFADQAGKFDCCKSVDNKGLFTCYGGNAVHFVNLVRSQETSSYLVNNVKDVINLSQEDQYVLQDSDGISIVQLKGSNVELRNRFAGVHASAVAENHLVTLTAAAVSIYDIKSGSKVYEGTFKRMGSSLISRVIPLSSASGTITVLLIGEDCQMDTVTVNLTSKKRIEIVPEWTRHEALAYISSVEMIDLPLSEAEANIETEFSMTNGNAWHAFVQRLMSQFDQIRRSIAEFANEFISIVNSSSIRSFSDVVAILKGKNGAHSSGAFERDYFNLKKLIVATTLKGAAYGIDNTDGNVRWVLTVGNDFETLTNSVTGEDRVPLLIQRGTAHYKFASQAVIAANSAVMKRGCLIVFNPITGHITDKFYLQNRLRRIELLPFHTEEMLHPLVAVETNMDVTVYPSVSSVPDSSNHIHMMWVENDGRIHGTRLDVLLKKLTPTWQSDLGLSKDEKVISVAGKPPHQKMHSQGRVLGDRSVLYKYSNPNLVAVSALDSAHSVLSISLFDAVTGQLLYVSRHTKAAGPFNMVHCENWLAYTFWNERARRMDLGVMELFDGAEQCDSERFNSLTPRKNLPIVTEQAYVFSQGISAMAVTDTEKGLTTRSLLIAMPFGGLFEVSRRFVDARRPVEMTPEMREEMLIPYMPEILIATEDMINYNQSVHNVRGIKTVMAEGDASRLVLCDIGSAHGDDVKATVRQNNGFTTVGRDGCVFRWEPLAGTTRYTCDMVTQMDVSANSIALLKRHDGMDNLFVGLSTGSIVCISPVTGMVCCTLDQHQANVCALHVDQDARMMISGSWDETAVVWDLSGLYEGLGGECKRIVLRGHGQSVWAVTSGFSANHFLTGSADKTIKYWYGETMLQSMTGPDIVRAIERLEHNRFYTLFNSGSVGLWDLETQTIIAKYDALCGHFMYAMKIFTTPDQHKYLMMCGEDGNVELSARDTNDFLAPVEAFRLPAHSVWTVQLIEGDRIVFGASDNNTYVFTFNKDIVTDPDMQNLFQSKMNAIDNERRERLQKESNNQVITIKVSLEEGAPLLDLHYRKGTDPGVAAQEFMLLNDVPQNHYQEIVEFIKQVVPDSARQETLTKRRKEVINIDGEVYDFALEVTLEGGKEVKVGYNAGENYEAAADRFVKKHNLHPSMTSRLSAMLRSQFPSATSDVAQDDSSPVRPVSHLYPLRLPIYFEKCPVAPEKAIGKLTDYNDRQSSDLKLNKDELLTTRGMFLEQEPDINILVGALEKGLDWSLQHKLPMVDLLRLAILRPEVNAYFFASSKDTLSALRAILLTSEEQNVIITVCRVLCNAFKHSGGLNAMTGDIESWIKILIGTVMRLWPGAQLMASCVLANYAYCLSSYAGKCDNVAPREDALFSILIETSNALQGYNESHEGSFKIVEEAAKNILRSLISLLWGDEELIKARFALILHICLIY
ncbi:hypothetical protein QR680_000096 [Steinernema hermaphroditum]|uniref:ER membrane protein complex subunit 1 n=1 Tax=Steinernema hermaphroditum TaxID=289476 RepID=A0AA39GVC1_9BILA|nr:hypothetical protein QR680_000096 [Steinernema hermaphroditum]